MSLQKCFFLTDSYNPNEPEDEWTLVYEKTTSGAFSYTAEWGKYKIEISGGGGSGGATARAHLGNSHSETNGSNGESLIKYSNVGISDTVTFSGTIGSGAQGSYAESRRDESPIFTPSPSAGAAGTGFDSGTKGTAQYYKHSSGGGADSWSCASGSGGGSSSVFSGNTLLGVARGGNGGIAKTLNISQQNGGIGGSGGVSSGSGATGGVAAAGYNDSNVRSGTGSDGWVKIYKSNIKPEPV